MSLPANAKTWCPQKDLKKEKQKLLGLRVDWVIYLFSAKKQGDDKFTVTFNSSRTGFGVVLVADIDVFNYIGIVTARQGARIRVTGIITGIDTNGTGQINLNLTSVGLAS